MEPSLQLTDIADAIRLAVTPIFLLAGVGITVNILIARLGRIVDRARVLAGQPRPADACQPLQTELGVLSRRARVIYQAIALSITCALSLCLTVTTLFVGSLAPRCAAAMPLRVVVDLLPHVHHL